MKKNIKTIIITIIISIILSVLNVETIFNENTSMIQILLSILGLCLTSYTFILIPIQSLASENKNNHNLISVLLNEYRDNMQLIFISCIFLILIDIIYKINFPFISDPLNIDFGIFKIYSLKTFFKILLEDFLSILSLYSFYDIIKSIFILVNNSYINKK